MRTPRPRQCVGELLDRRVAAAGCGRNCRRCDTRCANTDIETVLVRQRPCELSDIDIREEQHRPSGQTETRFVDNCGSQRRTQCYGIGETIRSLIALIREVRESRVCTVKKIHQACEELVVPDVFQLMFLCQIEIQTNSREITRLTALIGEGETFQVRIGQRLNGSCLRR